MILKAALAVVAVNVLSLVIVPIAYGALSIPFSERNAWGVREEPRWLGWLALYGGTAGVSGVVGYGLGVAAKFRFLPGLLTGGAAGLVWVTAWYVRESLRGYDAGPLEVTTWILVALACPRSRRWARASAPHEPAGGGATAAG